MRNANNRPESGTDAEIAEQHRETLRQTPDDLPSLVGLAKIAQKNGLFTEAIRLLRQALRCGGETPELLNSLGVSFVQLGDLENGRRCFQRGIDRYPTAPDCYSSLAYIHFREEKYDDAEQAYLAAVASAEYPLEATYNLATFYREIGKFEAAIAIYRKMLPSFPTDHALRDGLSKALLQSGHWEEGWREYEHRYFVDDVPPVNLQLPIPRWQGELLDGKHLLVLAEQGIGDEIQFASCYHDVIALAKRCSITCDPRLLAILEHSFPAAHVIPVPSTQRRSWCPADATAFDYFVAAGSLPGLLRRNSHTLKGEPYLAIPPGQVEPRREEHSRQQKVVNLRVGISWRGGMSAEQELRRSLAPDVLVGLLDIARITFVNLQHSPDPTVAIPPNFANAANVESHPEINPYQDLESWMKLIQGLDLLISVDNSNVHFSGALGIPTWVLLSENANWRWPINASVSPWYHCVEIIRKARGETWDSVVTRVHGKLSTFVEENSGAKPNS